MFSSIPLTCNSILHHFTRLCKFFLKFQPQAARPVFWYPPHPQGVTPCYTILLNRATPKMFLRHFKVTRATSFRGHERAGMTSFWSTKEVFHRVIHRLWGGFWCPQHHATRPGYTRDTPGMHEFFDVRTNAHFRAFTCKMNALSRNVPYARSFAKKGGNLHICATSRH